MNFRSAIVKLTATCNTDSTCSYLFNQTDQACTSVPSRMAPQTAVRLLEHICAYHPRDAAEPFSIVLQGGETLLRQEQHLLDWLELVMRKRADGWKLDIAVQTSLVRPLTAQLIDLFHRAGVSLGVSLDGPPALNGAVRADHQGRGTYERVMENVNRLLASGDGALLGGFRSVANPAIAPPDYLAWVCSLPLTKMDVLWPIEFNWRNPPWGAFPRAAYEQQPRYGNWFADLFDAWWRLDDPSIHIRLFRNLVDFALGCRDHIDMLANDGCHTFVVNTDGSFEYPDYLRLADGAARTAFNVERHAIAALHADPGFARLLRLRHELPQACIGCRHQSVCGGGFLPGRSDPHEFISSRPSVLCADQMRFFDIALSIIRDAVSHRESHVPIPYLSCAAA